ncbi:MAG: FAD-dependent oxidoreductase, partial [Elusimicrobiota bacterium]|nr:FAD-dependent oxidoreductase [Elusimicrobiota bacterium]
TAGIYGARAGFKTMVLGGKEHGGQLVKTNDIENFPGFAEPLSGFEVMDKMHKQCKRLGVHIHNGVAVKIHDKKHPFLVELQSGEHLHARCIIVATGSYASWLGIPSEKQFIGKGVSTCATCDGYFYKNKEVCVVGGGNTAIEEALFLTNFCSKVYLIHRREGFRAHKITLDKARANARIEMVVPYVVQEVKGTHDGVNAVVVTNTATGEVKELPLSGVFVSIGTAPQTEFLKHTEVKLLHSGHVAVNRRMQTNVPGVFAAGDCADELHNQAIIAAGAGAKAGMEAVLYLNEL